MFKGIPPGSPVFRPWLIPHVIAPTEPFAVGGITVRAFPQDHGFSTTMGLNFGDVVYSTDIVELPELSKPFIAGCKVWILGVLSDAPYPTHVHLEKALAWIAELKPQRTVITHMSNALDHDSMIAHLPVGVTPAFDGMIIEA